jgi:hypothetical protein
MAMGLGKDTAPTIVSADNDAVARWHSRYGVAASMLASSTGTLVGIGGGTEAAALRVTLATDSTGVVSIDDNGGALTVDGTVGISGSVAVTGTFWQATQPVSVASTLNVQGPTAADSAITANPVTTGGRASAAVPTAVNADGDVVNAWLDRNGRQVTVHKAATATLSNVASSATSVTVLASNTSRVGATVMNDSTQVLYLKMGATASATSFTVKMVAGAYYEVPFGYTGVLDGIWASANGSARVTEIT